MQINMNIRINLLSGGHQQTNWSVIKSEPGQSRCFCCVPQISIYTRCGKQRHYACNRRVNHCPGTTGSAWKAWKWSGSSDTRQVKLHQVLPVGEKLMQNREDQLVSLFIVIQPHCVSYHAKYMLTLTICVLWNVSQPFSPLGSHSQLNSERLNVSVEVIFNWMTDSKTQYDVIWPHDVKSTGNSSTSMD